MNDKQTQQLADLIAAEEAAHASGCSTAIHLAGEFHIVLASMTGNATLLRYISELVALSSLVLALFGHTVRSECAAPGHRAILSALVSGDSEQAVRILSNDLETATVRAVLRENRNDGPHDILANYAAAEGLI